MMAEGKRERIFALVWGAHGLEPNRRPIGFIANQAERWAGIELAEPAVEVKPPCSDLLLHPALEIGEPAKPSERAARCVLRVSHGLGDSLPYRLNVTSVTERALDQGVDRNPFLFALSFVVRTTWFHYFVADLRRA